MAVLADLKAKSALFWEIRGYHTHVSRTGALFAMQHNGWDHALKVTGGGAGLVGMPARFCSARPLTRRD